MDAPLTSLDALVRPWRTATLIASLIAAAELVLLVGGAFFLLAKPLSNSGQPHPAASTHAAARHAVSKPAVPLAKPVRVGKATLSRAQTGVLVLNGNGRTGAAAAAAGRLTSFGYKIRATGNAPRQDYATTLVMYRSGYHAEAVRLARDLHLRVVGGLEGLTPRALQGAQLAVVLGAS